MRKLTSSLLILGLLLLGNVHMVQAHWNCRGPYRFWVTAYDDNGETATQTWTRPGVIAVDPNIIGYGSTVWVSGIQQYSYRSYYHAEDTGGFSGDWVDVWVATAEQAFEITGFHQVKWCK